MKIDNISKQLIRLSLYLDKKVPGIVSEIWIDEADLQEIKNNLPSDDKIEQEIVDSFNLLGEVADTRRKAYLEAMLNSIKYQISILNEQPTYDTFTKNAFGFEIQRVTDHELEDIESQLKKLEKELGKSCFEVYKDNSLNCDDYQSYFQKSVEEIKSQLPSRILGFKDEGFEFELTSDKPWSAFNSHIALFKSRLTLNSDVSFSKMDLYRLASHEAYGGHHSELSNKDQLLIEEGRGEHGLVVTFSPQTFVSEAIAEGMYVLLGLLDQNDPVYKLGWYYDRLTFALQNLATFMFFDENMTKQEIIKSLADYGVTDKTKDYIANFSTDPLFGKYAPVYYSAFNFIQDLYQTTSKKDELVTTLFTKPTTVDLLVSEFTK